MKRFAYLVLLAAAFLFAGVTTASAAYYEFDYNEGSYTSSVSNTFTIDDFSGIDSATLSITIKGRTYHETRSNYWLYWPVVDISASGTQYFNNRALTSAWETIVIELDAAVLASMTESGELLFTVAGDSSYWQSNSSSGYTAGRFYLDSVGLTVTPSSTVPVPGAVWLLGSGLAGMVGIRRKNWSSNEGRFLFFIRKSHQQAEKTFIFRCGRCLVG